MPELLPPQLKAIPGNTSPSHGAHLQADPALDLTDLAERTEQVDRWLDQIGLDAGLLGMEQLVGDWRQSTQDTAGQNEK